MANTAFILSIVAFIFAIAGLGLGIAALIKVISSEKSTHSAIVSGYSTLGDTISPEKTKETYKVFDNDLMDFGNHEEN